MSNDDRFEKAKRLAELTDSGRSYIRGSKKSVDVDSPRRKHEARMAELYIELRAKHMTSVQLDVLLSFYNSDMGKSILDALERIRGEMSKKIALSMENLSTIGVRVPGKNGDTNTFKT